MRAILEKRDPWKRAMDQNNTLPGRWEPSLQMFGNWTTFEYHTSMLWGNIRAVSEEFDTIFVLEVLKNACFSPRVVSTFKKPHLYFIGYSLWEVFHAVLHQRVLIWTRHSVYLCVYLFTYLVIYSLTYLLHKLFTEHLQYLL